MAQEHLVQHAAKAVDVAAFVDLLGTRCLLRTHVPHGAEGHPGPGQTLTTRCTHGTGDAEVRDDRLASGKQHVLRLDVAVDDAVGVGVAERTRDLLGHPDRLVERESSLFRQPDPERWPIDERHDVIQQPADVARVIQRDDVRMAEASRDLDLTEEPLRTQAHRQFRAQHLERDRPIVFDVTSLQHDRHPAAAKLALDLVPIGEGGAQTLEQLDHG
jgi:hypothetical protein